MLWAKKVLHWTKTPQDAIAILEELNNKYALDGRDPIHTAESCGPLDDLIVLGRSEPSSERFDI